MIASTTMPSLRPLILLLVINVLASIAHYVDNVLYFSEYPEPEWLDPCIIDGFWFLMTPFALFGYWYYRRGWPALGRWAIVAYSLMSMLALGHYLIAPPWEVSFKINAFILLEAIAALVLLAYVWLAKSLRVANLQ